MANNLDPKLPVEDTSIEELDLPRILVSPEDGESFDDALVPGDVFEESIGGVPVIRTYDDPDMRDPSAGLVVPIDNNDPQYLPVPSIDPTSITKTRRVQADGSVVYDIKFNVSDVGASSYEVAFAKQ